MDHFFNDFVLLFTVIDPIGSVPVFIAVAAGAPPAIRARMALRAAAIAASVLLFFIVAGQFLLQRLDIELAALRIAGGIILFLFALNMVFGMSKPEAEVQAARKALKQAERDRLSLDRAVYPLAIPSISGPGSITAVVVLTDNAKFSLAEQAMTAAAMLLVISITLCFMLAATRVHRLIGDVGASVISRVMGLLFAAMAADGVLSGIKEYFHLP